MSRSDILYLVKVLYNVIKCTEANEKIHHLINDFSGALQDVKDKEHYTVKAEIDMKRKGYNFLDRIILFFKQKN